MLCARTTDAIRIMQRTGWPDVVFAFATVTTSASVCWATSRRGPASNPRIYEGYNQRLSVWQRKSTERSLLIALPRAAKPRSEATFLRYPYSHQQGTDKHDDRNSRIQHAFKQRRGCHYAIPPSRKRNPSLLTFHFRVISLQPSPCHGQ